jgi:hypothetical protein
VLRLFASPPKSTAEETPLATHDSPTSYTSLSLNDSDLDTLVRLQACYHLATKDDAVRFAIRHVETSIEEATFFKEVIAGAREELRQTQTELDALREERKSHNQELVSLSDTLLRLNASSAQTTPLSVSVDGRRNIHQQARELRNTSHMLKESFCEAVQHSIQLRRWRLEKTPHKIPVK